MIALLGQNFIAINSSIHSDVRESPFSMSRVLITQVRFGRFTFCTIAYHFGGTAARFAAILEAIASRHIVLHST
jgi:hypothetical protein